MRGGRSRPRITSLQSLSARAAKLACASPARIVCYAVVELARAPPTGIAHDAELARLPCHCRARPRHVVSFARVQGLRGEAPPITSSMWAPRRVFMAGRIGPPDLMG
jgi:hypothetical protein